MKAPIAMSSNGSDDSRTKALRDSCLLAPRIRAIHSTLGQGTERKPFKKRIALKGLEEVMTCWTKIIFLS